MTTGIATREDLLSRSGLDFMRAMLAGDLPPPPMAETMNFTASKVEDGRVIFTGSATGAHLNPMGGVHGGWFGAILDSCMACAVMTKVPKGSVYTTLDYHLNLTGALKPGLEVTATGTVEHAGRTTAVARGEIRGQDGRLYATGSTTCLIMTVAGDA